MESLWWLLSRTITLLKGCFGKNQPNCCAREFIRQEGGGRNASEDTGYGSWCMVLRIWSRVRHFCFFHSCLCVKSALCVAVTSSLSTLLPDSPVHQILSIITGFLTQPGFHGYSFHPNACYCPRIPCFLDIWTYQPWLPNFILIELFLLTWGGDLAFLILLDDLE